MQVYEGALPPLPPDGRKRSVAFPSVIEWHVHSTQLDSSIIITLLVLVREAEGKYELNIRSQRIKLWAYLLPQLSLELNMLPNFVITSSSQE